MFVPLPIQRELLECSVYEVLYGGAAGGGKSYAILADAVRHIVHRQYRGLIIRRTMPDLHQLISDSFAIYTEVDPRAKFNRTMHTWTFSTGAEIQFGYLESDDDRYRYQGKAYQAVYWDELTQHPTKDNYIWMFSRIRAPGKFMPCYVRATANPGGAGHAWVKERFIDPAPGGRKYIRDRKTGRLRYFIPALLQDNVYLDEDGEYRRNLMALPPIQRKALLEGRWDIAEGAVFVSWDPSLHVVPATDIDLGRSGRRWRSGDWGFTKPGCILWHHEDADGNVTTYREHYFTKQDPTLVADYITKVEAAAGEADMEGVLDPACWSRTDGGPSIADTFWRSGTRWCQANNDRENGLIQVHQRLATVNKVTIGGVTRRVPAWRISSVCTNLIRTLPYLQPSETGRDVDTKQEDHAYDSARYGLMYYPMGTSSHRRHGKANDADAEWEARWASRDGTTGY